MDVLGSSGAAVSRPSRERPFGRRDDRYSGYARVFTGDQDVAGQTMRLTQAGAIRVFTDVRSGRNMDRPGLQELLSYARKGDTLAVVRLDRLGRSLGELLATVTMLKERGIALLSLAEKIDTSSAAGELVSMCSAPSRTSRDGSSPSGRRTVSPPLVREGSDQAANRWTQIV